MHLKSYKVCITLSKCNWPIMFIWTKYLYAQFGMPCMLLKCKRNALFGHRQSFPQNHNKHYTVQYGDRCVRVKTVYLLQ